MLLCETMTQEEVRTGPQGQRMTVTEFERTNNKTSRRKTVMHQRKVMKSCSVCVALNILTVLLKNGSSALCPSFQIKNRKKKKKSNHIVTKKQICKAMADIICGRTHLSNYCQR